MKKDYYSFESTVARIRKQWIADIRKLTGKTAEQASKLVDKFLKESYK